MLLHRDQSLAVAGCSQILLHKQYGWCCASGKDRSGLDVDLTAQLGEPYSGVHSPRVINVTSNTVDYQIFNEHFLIVYCLCNNAHVVMCSMHCMLVLVL